MKKTRLTEREQVDETLTWMERREGKRPPAPAVVSFDVTEERWNEIFPKDKSLAKRVS